MLIEDKKRLQIFKKFKRWYLYLALLWTQNNGLVFLNKWLERITYFCFNEDKNFFCLYCTDLEAELNQSVIKICVSESFVEQLASIESVPIKKCLCQNMI